MELLLVHITDIHIENDADYNILDEKSVYIANAINKHIIDEKNTLLIICITGDIAYSGKEEQYLSASIIFSDIIESMELLVQQILKQKRRSGRLFWNYART